MAKKLIDVQANGFKSYVDATAAAVGAEPALGNPGPGTWYLRAIDNVRSWVAQIPWAGVDKTGAVASDIGALPEIAVIGSINFNSINSGLPCSAEISPSIVTNGPPGYAAPTKAHLLQSKGAANYLTQVLTTATAVAFRGMTSPGVWGAWRYVWDDAYLPISSFSQTLLDDANAVAARATLGALASNNPTPTGTLTAPDVVVSNLAEPGSHAVAADSTGKLVIKPLGWNSYDIQTVTGTTAATEAFSSGSGAGSATLVGGSLSVGDRLRVHFAVRSSVADSATLTAKIGAATICSFVLYVGSDDTLDIDMTVTSTGVIASSRRTQGINGTVWVGLANLSVSLASDQAISITITPATTSYQFARYIAKLDIN